MPLISMFPLPPDKKPIGKEGDPVSFHNPITEIPDVVIDSGITDAALFILSPNESRKFNDAVMIDYNYVNMSDAIKVQGAKCYLNWVDELVKQISIVHTEFFVPGLPDRTTYISRTVGKNAQEDPSQIAPPSNKYDQPCTMVVGKSTAKHPPETRKWIHHLRRLHPLVDKKIESFDLFKPVSEHMGENVITYNSDTCSVDIDFWAEKTKTEENIINPMCVFAYGTPHHFREIMRERLHFEQPDPVNDAWTELNKLMAKNMPIEARREIEDGVGLWIDGPRDPKKPHGLSHVNDFYHWMDRIDPIKIPVANDLFAYLKDACQLVNHMYPVLNKVKSEDRTYMYEPILSKTVDNEWTIYKTAAPVGGGVAPLDVEYTLDKWGYEGTEVVVYDWPVNVGLAIEETFPRKKPGSGTFEADIVGNKLKNTKNASVDNNHLVPEIIEVPAT